MNKKYERYINYILNNIQKPYFKNMEENYGLSEKEYKPVLSKLFNQEIIIESYNNAKGVYNLKGNEIYSEDKFGYWTISEYDDNGNETYSVDSYGRKIKTEYNNNNGHTVYYENEDGYWYKQLYDIHNNLIYFEDSNGNIDDYRYEEGN